MASLFSQARSLRLFDLASLNATRAHTHTLRVPVCIDRTDILQIRQEATLRNACRVQTNAALILRRTLANDYIPD